MLDKFSFKNSLFLLFIIIFNFFIYKILTVFEFSVYVSFIFIFIYLLVIFQMYRLSYNGVLLLFLSLYGGLIMLIIATGYNVFLHNKLIIVNFGQIMCISSYYQIFLIFIFDYISMFFLGLVSLITFIVLIFTKNYFKLEPELNKFIILIVSFSVSMIFLVISANFILFFLFWELIGLTSFFLINFYSLKGGVSKASFKAFYFNKISDSCILMGSILFIQNGVDLMHIIPGSIKVCKIPNYSIYFLCVGASIKSSQLGFHFWLPDSMEAPVPASALIHSATLVSAGVYILIRLHDYIIFFKFFYTFLYVWFSLTAVYGGLIAMYQIDLKRLLAYSTISHCGFLLVTTLNGNIKYTLIYLFLHGMFKALSFIMAGRLIQQLETQDLRLMTQVVSVMPAESIIFLFILFNLAALPGSIGLYYKSIFISSLFLKNFNLIILSLNFVGCLSGVGYFIHVWKIFFSSEIKLPKVFPIKRDSEFGGVSNNISIIVLFLTFFTFSISLVMLNNIVYLELINFGNEYVFKLFYSFMLSYLVISINIDNRKRKNYFVIYYICYIIIICLINWK